MIRITAIILFMLFSYLSWSQSNYHPEIPIKKPVIDVELEFDHFTVSEGLASNEVYYVYQDNYGYLWFGTDNGLSRFDGYRFLNYRHNSHDSTSISNNWITGIDEDIYGNLWISTQNGLNKFNRRNETFEQFFSQQGNLNSPSHNYIRTIYADDEGNIWLETVNSFLDMYDIQADSFYHYKHHPYNKIYPLHYHAHHIYQEENGTLWIGTRNIGAYNFDRNDRKFIQHFISSNDSEWGTDIYSLSNFNVTCFYEDNANHLWIGSSTSPLNIYDKETKIFYRYHELKDIYTICDAGNNKLWMGTSSNGIFIYDLNENTLCHILNNPDNQKSLSDNSINYIFKDHSENLWIATNKGVSRYNDEKDRFLRFRHEAGNPNSISENNITALIEDHENNIWIGTLRNGLNKYNRKTGKITPYNKENSTLSSNRVSYLLLDSKNDLYVGLMAGIGFDRYDFNTNSFQRFVYKKNSTRKDWYRHFLEDSNGNLWVALWGAEGFVKFDRDKGLFSSRVYYGANNNYKTQQNSKIIAFPQHVFPIYNSTNLYSYNVESNEFYFFTDAKTLIQDAHHNDELGMPNYGLSSIPYTIGNIIDIETSFVKDIMKSGQLLVISSENKIIIFDQEKNKVVKHINIDHSFVFQSNQENILWLISDNKLIAFNFIDESIQNEIVLEKKITQVTKAVESERGDIIIIADKKLYQFKAKNKQIQEIENEDQVNDFVIHNDNLIFKGTSSGLQIYNVQTKENKLIAETKTLNINSLCKINDTIFLGTDFGLYLYSLQSEQFSTVNEYNVSENQIFSIDYDNNGKLWLATEKGFSSIDLQTKHIYSSNQPDSLRLSTQLITTLYEDSKQRIWLGTANMGVSVFYPEKEIFEHYLPDEKNEKSVHASYVNFIFEDSRGTMYVGNDVLNIFSPENKQFNILSPGNSWLPGKPMGMLEDGHKNLWISTENGIVKYNAISKEYIVFNEDDGLQGNQFTKAHYKLKTGEMMFGGIKGFTLFHPDSIKESTYQPKLEITQFDILNTPAYFDFTNKDTIKISHKENFFTIYFASFDYTTPSKNKFKYKLEGIDKNWVLNTSDHKANYTNVPPGNYVFRVLGTNNDGHWSIYEEKLYIIIEPAFWQTTLFKISVIILVLLGIIYFFVQWVRRIKMLHKNMELEQRLLRSQMNPHFIFNSLTAIQYYIFGNDPAKAGKYLSGFAKLIRLILQNSRSEYILLEKEIETLEHYLKLQQLRFENKFDFQIVTDEKLNPEMVLVPPMLAQPFIENSIEHGIKNIEYKGEISIHYNFKNNFLEVVIEDNGIGIDISLKEKKILDPGHKSLGTSITKERLVNIAKRKKHKINFEIIDKKKIDKSKSGTVVRYILPLNYGV